LNGKRPVSWKVVRRLAPRVGLDPYQAEKFLHGARVGVPVQLEEEGRPAVDYVQLSYDAFQVIADWYHYAILELLTVDGFQASPRWIALNLGIKVPEATDALERLMRLGMIKRTAAGGFVLSPESHTTVGTPHASAALRKLQKQMLSMAIEALEETPMEERDQSAMTMAIDSRLLPEAKERIKKFRRSLCAFLQEGRKRDRVFHLSVSLYPVSKRSGSKSGKGQKA
jgi:uncharacterized protein (TIGR02147 family)